MFRLYRQLKYGLIIISVLTTFFIFYLVHTNDLMESEKDNDALDPLHNAPPTAKTQTTAKKALFHATDAKGQAYKIQAESAKTRESDGHILLTLPSYAIKLTNNLEVTVTALKGELDQNTKELTLEGDVVVTYGKDTAFKMPHTRIDLQKGDAFGHQSIHMTNDKIQIDAGAFEIYHKGDKIVLTDRPVLTFDIKRD